MTFAALAMMSLLLIPIYGQTTTPTFSNPSVIHGSQADLHGPRVSAIKYPIFTSDHAALQGLLAGQVNIMDYKLSSLADVQTALSTNYLNVTSQSGGSFEYLLFNMYSPAVPGYDINFRRAIAHLVNYTYAQSTVMSGVLGIATPRLLLPSAFGDFAATDVPTYPYSLALASASLALDPQLKWNPTASKPTSSNTIACDGSPGVWQYSNGTAFSPVFISRPDHPDWWVMSQKIWRDAAQIGLCLSLEPKVHFGSVYPIIYKHYSNNWGMYFGGSSFAMPLDAVAYEFDAFTKDPGWTNPFFNTVHFYNATMEPIMHDMFTTTDPVKAAADSRQIDVMELQNIPQLGMWWDSWIIPSLNNYNGQYWTGYANVPGFGTWTFGTGPFTSMNAHMVDPATGKTIVGGTLGVSLHEAPDDLNPFQETSVYDADISTQVVYWDTPMQPNPGNPTLGNYLPWMVTSLPEVTTGVTTTTPHGYKIVNGMTITLNFMNNITFTDNVRMTANDYNFSLWYENLNGASVVSPGICSAPCWYRYANYSSADYTGLMSDLTDSVVNSPTSVTVYVNGTGLEDIKYVELNPIFPEHLWSQVNSTAFNNDIDPTSNTVNGASLYTGVGPFMLSQWVRSQYVLLNRNPGYFRTDIWDWSLTAAPGATLPLSVQLTQQGTPIPTSSSVVASVLQNGQSTGVSTNLASAGGSTWNGTLNTASLAGGFYEIVVNGTYEDAHMQSHEALQFWGLNVGAASTTGVGPVAVAGLPTYVIASAVIVVLIVIGLVFYAARRRKKS
jgi:ABC-type transport system substrate-binding protein